MAERRAMWPGHLRLVEEAVDFESSNVVVLRDKRPKAALSNRRARALTAGRLATPEPALAPAGPVIRAKVRPPVTEGWVARPRVEGLVAEAVESGQVVVVSATAGSGKTTLAAAAAHRLRRPVAWLTLDWTDTAPGRLVTYLEAALAVAVPRVDGVGRDALAARIPHPEAVGLLVEAVAGERLVLVLDELERLRHEPRSWAVMEALMRHAPRDMRFILCSRRPVPAFVLPRRPGEVTRLGDDALALTEEEAAQMLQGLNRPSVDPATAVQATGGWVTGVLFESWRIAEQDDRDRRDDPLSGYLSAHILGDLPVEDREFLIATSVLGDITAARATALGVRDATTRLASLRCAHIPATWSGGPRTLRCHPRFREYLQDCLNAREAETLRVLHVAHGRLLASEGHHEEATQVLLGAGAKVEALDSAARAIVDVIDRLDFALAKEWLDALADVEPVGMSPFVMARLTLAVATENYRLGVEAADRLAASGRLDEVAASSSLVAFMISLCYGISGRCDDMLAVAALAPQDADSEALRALTSIFTTDAPPPLPELTGGKLDHVLLPIMHRRGQLAKVLEVSGAVGWLQRYSQPSIIATLADVGRIQEAQDLYAAARARGLANPSLEAVIGPRVLTDAGRREDALETLRHGRERARATSALLWELMAGVEEARLRLRLDRDPAGALAALIPVDRHEVTHRVAWLGSQVDSWYGFALLLAGRDAAALKRLRRAVAIERRTQMLLMTPMTAVWLAEAEWRAGNLDAADEAADLALQAAGVQGFNHMLLQALRDFPEVLSRRLDAEGTADSQWHELGRALHTQVLEVTAPARPAATLMEFGHLAVLVDGAEVKPRIAKSYELLAYLLTRPQHQAQRDELLDVLFDSRADDSARSYLRQAIRWLRSVLPPDAVITKPGAIALSSHVAVVSESKELEHALVQSARLRGADRLSATLGALEIADRGPYLPGIESQWVHERREQLRELAADARYEAAEVASRSGRLEDAERLTNTVLASEPFHEAAWRLAMRLASARGDHHAVLRSYRRLVSVLAEVGAEPSATTRQLVNQLRR